MEESTDWKGFTRGEVIEGLDKRPRLVAISSGQETDTKEYS